MSRICEGRVVIVTGAGRGIGRAHALEFARQGAKVVVNDLGAELDGTGGGTGPAGDVVDAIRAMGGEAVADMHSVSDPDSAQAIVDTALHTWGRVDILVNNAGFVGDAAFEDMTAQRLDPLIDVHLRGAVFVTRPAWKVMRENDYGRIVHTTSAAGLLGLGARRVGAAHGRGEVAG